MPASRTYKELRAKHAKFHVCVAHVLLQARTLTPDKALELLDPLKSDYGRASSECISAIGALQASVSKL